jgi:hypothetical protein
VGLTLLKEELNYRNCKKKKPTDSLVTNQGLKKKKNLIFRGEYKVTVANEDYHINICGYAKTPCKGFGLFTNSTFLGMHYPAVALYSGNCEVLGSDKFQVKLISSFILFLN